MSAIPYSQFTPGPTLVRPVVPVVVTPPRRTINPLIPMCLLGLILFLIAATIVLALIPVYLRRRGDFGPAETVPFTVLYRINNGTLPGGPLTSDNCATIQTDQQNIAAANRDVNPAIPQVVDCTATQNTTVSRKRQLPEVNLITLTEVLRGARFCRRTSCLVPRAQRFINILLARGTFFLTLAGSNGTRYLFSLTVITAAVAPSLSAARLNDIAILNYALILENLEASFYTRFQNNFTAQDFIRANFTQQNYDYFNIIYVHELAHVRALRAIISQLGGTPVDVCTYNFDGVTDVRSYIQTARALENTGTMAYDGAVNGLADPMLRQTAATVATVEARHAAYLNLIQGVLPFPLIFENATVPSVIIQAIAPFIRSCPFTITAPTVPYIGATSFTGTVPSVNVTSPSEYTFARYTNDINALNYALIAEQLEAAYYNQFVSAFNSSAYTRNGFPDASNYFIVIREHENAHVQFLRMTISQRGGTPVNVCSYNFTVGNVTQFIQTARVFENTGVKAYDGAIGAITDPNLIMGAATIATVEARHASYLNLLDGSVPFPDIFDSTLTPTQVVAALSAFQTCPFTPQIPVVLSS